MRFTLGLVLVTLVMIAPPALATTPPLSKPDPATLDEAVAEVERMQRQGLNNGQILVCVNAWVDRRIIAGNSLEGDVARYKGYYTDDLTVFQKQAGSRDFPPFGAMKSAIPRPCGFY